MQVAKRRKLEAAGWKAGTADEFLGLTAEEAAYLDIKQTLSQALRERRLKRNLSQVELAKLVNSSQSRVAKMEAGDPSVSMDLLVKSLLVLGASAKDLGKTISR